MLRLIWSFAGCIYHIVGNLVSRLNCECRGQNYFLSCLQLSSVECVVQRSFILKSWKEIYCHATQMALLHRTCWSRLGCGCRCGVSSTSLQQGCRRLADDHRTTFSGEYGMITLSAMTICSRLSSCTISHVPVFLLNLIIKSPAI